MYTANSINFGKPKYICKKECIGNSKALIKQWRSRGYTLSKR